MWKPFYLFEMRRNASNILRTSYKKCKIWKCSFFNWKKSLVCWSDKKSKEKALKKIVLLIWRLVRDIQKAFTIVTSMNLIQSWYELLEIITMGENGFIADKLIPSTSRESWTATVNITLYMKKSFWYKTRRESSVDYIKITYQNVNACLHIKKIPDTCRYIRATSETTFSGKVWQEFFLNTRFSSEKRDSHLILKKEATLYHQIPKPH